MILIKSKNIDEGDIVKYLDFIIIELKELIVYD